MHVRVSAPSPCGFNRSEHIRISSDKIRLFVWGQLDYPPLFIWTTERCEDSATHTEIRMAHVRGLNCLREAKCEASKFGRRHLAFIKANWREISKNQERTVSRNPFRTTSTAPALARRSALLWRLRLGFRGSIAVKQYAVRPQISDQRVQIVR